MTTKPITITVDVDERHMTYDISDAKIVAAAIGQALDIYMDQHGELGRFSVRAEEVELSEWIGIRLTLEGWELA